MTCDRNVPVSPGPHFTVDVSLSCQSIFILRVMYSSLYFLIPIQDTNTCSYRVIDHLQVSRIYLMTQLMTRGAVFPPTEPTFLHLWTDVFFSCVFSLHVLHVCASGWQRWATNDEWLTPFHREERTLIKYSESQKVILHFKVQNNKKIKINIIIFTVVSSVLLPSILILLIMCVQTTTVGPNADKPW